jgi:thiol:disulfide interchange protein
MEYQENQESRFQVGSRTIMGFVMAVAFFIFLFFMMKGIFTVLAWAAPFLLVGAVLINYRTIINFGKWLYHLIVKNPIMGVVAVVLCVFGFPVVAGFLFGKSLFDRKVRLLIEAQNPQEEFTEYEELSNERLELKELERHEPEERNEN